jgi:hypothetical protein
MRDAVVACEPAAEQPTASGAVVAAFQQLVHVWQVADLHAHGAADSTGVKGDPRPEAAAARAQQVRMHPVSATRLPASKVQK